MTRGEYYHEIKALYQEKMRAQDIACKLGLGLGHVQAAIGDIILEEAENALRQAVPAASGRNHVPQARM